MYQCFADNFNTSRWLEELLINQNKITLTNSITFVQVC